MESVTVSNGLFNVEMDFGDIFDGDALWLQIGVRLGAMGTLADSLERCVIMKVLKLLYCFRYDHRSRRLEQSFWKILFGSCIEISSLKDDQFGY